MCILKNILDAQNKRYSVFSEDIFSKLLYLFQFNFSLCVPIYFEKTEIVSSYAHVARRGWLTMFAVI